MTMMDSANDIDAPSILVVDDELGMREILEIMLQRCGYRVELASSGRKALEILATKRFDLLLCDIRLGDLTGLDVLKFVKEKDPATVVIMISAYASTETAVEAMNLGAYDYVPKPFNLEELRETLRKALDLKTLEREKQRLDDELQKTLHFGRIVGDSPQMMHVYKLIMQVAPTRTNILITGESGTGKELIARAIHAESDRADKPFVVINCGGIPETLMESELFGHKKGAFTSATQDKKGLFAVADKGTLFLDEIGEISIQLQVKLLRAIQERVFRPLGSNEDMTADLRIISATNKNLEAEVIAGRFREDLFYRLNVIEIKVPPLRERKSDLRLLAQHFLEKYSRQMNKQVTKISSYAIDLLQRYDFPGNIRELENLIERSVALATTKIILPDSLALSVHKSRWTDGVGKPLFDLDEVEKGVDLDHILEQIEQAYIHKALECTAGNTTKAAELLGLTVRSMRHRVSKFANR
jgi:two-component system response regulator PilR (NtrC family)